MPRISRRRFLHGSVAAGTAVAMTARSRSAVAGANERIRFGVIGTGGQGRHDTHTFFKVSGHDLDCPIICDVDNAMLAEAQKLFTSLSRPAPETTRNWREVLERKDVDVVLIGTPDHWHALQATASVEAGKDVFCEKPLANSIGECRAFVDAVRPSRQIVQMGTQWRMGTHWREAVELVHSGALGKIRLVRCWCALAWFPPITRVPDEPIPAGVDYDMWLGPAPQRPFNRTRFHRSFRWFWDYAGGLQTDWGVHLLNIALWAMKVDWPKRVSSSGGAYISDGFADTPDTQSTLFDFEKFTLMWEHQSGTGHGAEKREHGVAFYGQKGTLTAWSGGYEIEPEASSDLEPKKRLISEDGEACRVRLVENLLDCVKSRKQPEMHPEWGGLVTSVAHLGNLALRSGRSVEFDPQTMRCRDNDAATRLVTSPYRDPWKLPGTS